MDCARRSRAAADIASRSALRKIAARARLARATAAATLASAASSAARAASAARAIRGTVRRTSDRSRRAAAMSSSAFRRAVSRPLMVVSSVTRPSPSASRASATMAGSKPKRSAICSARERPGTPQRSLYVGASSTSSNSTAAFSKTPPSCSYFRALSSPWCVVASTRPAAPAPYPRPSTPARRSSSAPPMAAPSAGLVPVPTSSMSTSARGVTARKMALCLASRAENVERLCMRSCESPMSTSTSSNQGTLAISAGMNSPARAIRLASPTAFMAAVLPPVFGPVITTHRVERGTNTSTGTGPRVVFDTFSSVGEIPAARVPSNSASYSESSASFSVSPASLRFFFLEASFLAAARRAARRARIACASSTGCLSPASSTRSSFFSKSGSASSSSSSSSSRFVETRLPYAPARASVGNMAFVSASRALCLAAASASSPPRSLPGLVS